MRSICLNVWDSNSLLCFLVHKIVETLFFTKLSIGGSLFYKSREYNKLLGNLAHTFSFISWKLHSLFYELASTVWNSESRLMNRERFFPSLCSESQRCHSGCWCHFRSYLPASFVILYLDFFCYIVFGLGFWSTRLKFGPDYRRPWMVGGNKMQMTRCHSSLWATSGIHSRSAARTALLYPLFWTVAVMALFSTTSLTYLQSSFMEDSGGTSALWGNTQLFLLRSPHFDFAHITNLSLQTCSGQQEVSWKLKQLVELFLTTSSESIQ